MFVLVLFSCPMTLQTASAGFPTTPNRRPASGAYDYVRGWHLTCGASFHADICRSGYGYSLVLNMHPICHGDDIEELKRTAERHIAARVRKMLPAHKAIYRRVRAVDEAKGTVPVTVLKQGKTDASL
jgi:hypothetical protein